MLTDFRQSIILPSSLKVGKMSKFFTWSCQAYFVFHVLVASTLIIKSICCMASLQAVLYTLLTEFVSQQNWRL